MARTNSNDNQIIQINIFTSKKHRTNVILLIWLGNERASDRTNETSPEEGTRDSCGEK